MKTTVRYTWLFQCPINTLGDLVVVDDRTKGQRGELEAHGSMRRKPAMQYLLAVSRTGFALHYLNSLEEFVPETKVGV